MSLTILILGSGKMARNIGLWLARNGHSITMLSSCAGHRDECEKFMEKKFRRLKEIADGPMIAPLVRLYDDVPLLAPDMVIEATSEILDVKQSRFKAIDSMVSPKTVLMSATSSIVPDRIRPDCLGFHFFYPIELTRFAEIIAGQTASRENIEQLSSFASSLGLSYVVENETSAFCSNRVLMPVQAEALRMIGQGYAPQEIDSCTVSDLLPFGQLSLMDEVGLETVYRSVCNYRTMIPLVERKDYAVLENTVASMIAHGKKGRKNNSGFVCGSRAETGNRIMEEKERHELSTTFLCLFVNTCRAFLEHGIIDRESLDTILAKAFHAECTVKETAERLGSAFIRDRCGSCFGSTGLSYFKPSVLPAP